MQLGSGIGHGESLVSEQYNNSDSEYYGLTQSQLEQKGWSEQENYDKGGNNYQSSVMGSFSAETGSLMIKKTSPTDVPEEAGREALVYGVDKIFTYKQDNWQGDPNVSMRMQNFKGKYAIELTGSFNQFNSQVYYDILGKTASGEDAVVGRYRSDAGTYGYFSVYNNKLNGANTNRYFLWQDCRIKRKISTYINTASSTFKTLLNDNGIAVETLVEDAYPKDEFQMTDWNPKGKGLYITGIRISGQKQEPENEILAKIDELNLVEYVDEDTVVKEAAKALAMSYLTDNPNKVTEDLKELPSSINGMNITWSSNRPDIMSNSGKIIDEIIYDTNVVMTAKITDPSDGFTRYLDFNICLIKPTGIGERYLQNVKGETADSEHRGSECLSKYPAWSFTYPGIDNGKNREVHSSQVLAKNGYMVFKKISDRQTDNYNECMVGRRYLSYDGSVYSFRGTAELKITAKADGTGTFRFAPEALDGTTPFIITLDASNKKVSLTYANNGAQVIRDINVNPLTEHEYKMIIDTVGIFKLYIDANYRCDIYYWRSCHRRKCFKSKQREISLFNHVVDYYRPYFKTGCNTRFTVKIWQNMGIFKI